MKQERLFVLMVAALVLVGISTALAQAPATNGVPVQVVVTAEAHKGAEAQTVSANDVMVNEGKDRDPVTSWVPAQGEHAGLDLFILLDDSSQQNLGVQLDDIRKFINEQPSTTRVGVAYMQNGIAVVQQNLTSDHELAAKSLRLPLGMRTVNGSPYFAISDLMKRWPKSDARREVFMATDGIDPYYESADLLDPYLDAAIDDAERGGVEISAIYMPGVGHFGHSYWRTYWGQLYLAELTERTGGESYYMMFNGPPVAFAPYLKDFNDRLQHQYILTFVAKPEKKAGLRKIKVRTELSHVSLVAPDHVYVPNAPE
jgi:hypothetical protein